MSMGGKKIPDFASLEEEAAFWDNTSLDELDPDQLEEVEIERPARLRATFAVRLDADTVTDIRALAKSAGVGPTQLVRSWVLERLRIERAVGGLREHATDLPADLEALIRKRVVDGLLAAIPAVGEKALQEVLDKADQDIALLRDSG